MDRPKKKAIPTDQNLSEFTQGAGVLVLNLKEGDFIALGSSTFVGFSHIRSNCIKIGIVSTEEVQRYLFTTDPVKLESGE